MRNLGLFLVLLLGLSAPLWADGGDRGMGRGGAGGGGDRDGGGQASAPAPESHPSFHANQAPASHASSNAFAASRQAPSRSFKPVHIDISHPGSGANNRNFGKPADSPANSQPAYGQVNWKSQNSRPASSANTLQTRVYQGQQNNIRSFAQPGAQAAAAVHHHPYTEGYVRKKLQNIGVKKAPGYITDRAEIINTDRAHSIIRVPQQGPAGARLTAVPLSPRHFADPVVKNQMRLVVQPSMRQRVQQYNQLETAHGHYYWHVDNGFNYCHYVDDWGYHWYGWYVGNQCFWTRNYANRWWWFDPDYNRWCFWNAGFWWWQDPAHVGDLYCYNNDAYIPCNSAEDQIVVTVNSPANSGLVYTSPDGSRQVKVMGDSKDAFLYDTANPPSFAPVYLASEVSNVQFSNNAGRPLEIVLTLGDGTFDLFDGEGNPYGPGSYDADQAGDSAQYSDGTSESVSNPPAPPTN
ncbi:MAG TPA: hypothetical protein VMU88_04940 [bacterium]|nr:hypothetical protein [bacterium]